MTTRPRKLREDGVVSENGNTHIPPQSLDTKTISEKFKPYHGADSLIPGEPRFFVNGRKLLKVMKNPFGFDDNKNPLYKVERVLFRTIYDKTPEGKKLRSMLRQAGIPGA